MISFLFILISSQTRRRFASNGGAGNLKSADVPSPAFRADSHAAALNDHQLGVGDLFRQHFGGLHVAAGAAFVGILAADDDQGRRFDLMNQISRLMTLPRHDVAQITFERRHLVDDQLLILFDDLRMLLARIDP